MCRMFAKVSNTESSIMDEMLLCPTSLLYLADHGMQSYDPAVRGAHKDGCGLAFISNNKIEIHKRDKEHAWDDSYQEIVKHSKSKFFIAHNRLASSGLNTSIESTHPFSLTRENNHYAFCHNGTVYSYKEEAQERNTSDSLILFERLISSDKKVTGDEIAENLSEIISQTTYSSLCAFLLTDDELMAWRVFNEQSPKAENYKKYYTLHFSLRNNYALISSEPLDEGEWQLMPNYSFLSVKPSGSGLDLKYQMLN